MTQSALASLPGFTARRGAGVDRAGALVDAREDATGRRVLIRVLSPALTADAHLMRRVRGGAQLRTAMRHPHLVTVLAMEHRGHAVVYEWIDGATLADVATQPLDIAAALVLFDDVLAGLEAVHQRRLLHRDLRPESVMIDTSGNAARRAVDLPSPPLRAGGPAGTPQFMAPELWRGAQHSIASDLYAATCLFSLALSGRVPYEADDLGVLQRLHERADLPGATLPAPVRGLIAEGMAKDPRQRPADASRFRADLEVAAGAYLDDEWRQRGRATLAARARAAAATAAVSTLPEDDALTSAVLGSTAANPWWRNARVIAGAAVIALVLVVLVVVAASALTAPAPQQFTPPPVTVATPPGSASGSGAPFTPQQSPSIPQTTVPTPTQAPSISANPGATVSVAPAETPTPTPSPSASAHSTPCTVICT